MNKDDHKPITYPTAPPDIDQEPIEVPPLRQSPKSWTERLILWARQALLLKEIVLSRRPRPWNSLLLVIVRFLIRIFGAK